MLNLFCIILYTTFWPNHWLEVHKCPYLQNSIQDRCWNTEAATQSMLKHESCYTIRGRTCWNTELLHSPRMHMPKHEAATWFEDDAETQKLSLRNTDAETQWRPLRCWNTNLDSQQSRPTQSRGAIHVAETARELRCWNSISSYEKKPLHQL